MIKTVLKEYVFNPVQKTDKILDGIDEEINILGTEVAFSIFGKGNPEPPTEPLQNEVKRKSARPKKIIDKSTPIKVDDNYSPLTN